MCVLWKKGPEWGKQRDPRPSVPPNPWRSSCCGSLLLCSPGLLKPSGTFVQIRKSPPPQFLWQEAAVPPSVASGMVLSPFSTYFLGQAPLFSEQHVKLQVVVLALPFWVSSLSGGMWRLWLFRSRWCSPHPRWAQMTWSSTWHTFRELLTVQAVPMDSYLPLTFSLAIATTNSVS